MNIGKSNDSIEADSIKRLSLYAISLCKHI